jgi:MarR family 2-MHQ and catechol resistance regulon transcriptional repressor
MKNLELSLKTWVKLARSFNTINKVVNEEINTYGVTPSQFGVLEALYHLGDMPIGKLGEKILVTGGNMTVILDNLEKQGYIERIKSPTDRRSLFIKLTEKGKTLIDQVFPGHKLFVAEIISVLTEEEQIVLGSLLKKLGLSIKNKKEE